MSRCYDKFDEIHAYLFCKTYFSYYNINYYRLLILPRDITQQSQYQPYNDQCIWAKMPLHAYFMCFLVNLFVNLHTFVCVLILDNVFHVCFSMNLFVQIWEYTFVLYCCVWTGVCVLVLKLPTSWVMGLDKRMPQSPISNAHLGGHVGCICICKCIFCIVKYICIHLNL